MESKLDSLASALSSFSLDEAAKALSSISSSGPLDIHHIKVLHNAVVAAIVKNSSFVERLLDGALSTSIDDSHLLDVLLETRIYATMRASPNSVRSKFAREFIRKQHAFHGERPAILLLRGALDLYAGDRTAAKQLFCAAATARQLQFSRIFLGAHSVQNRDDSDWSSGQPHLDKSQARVSWVRRPSIRSVGPTILLGSDGNYFCKFAPMLASSLMAKSPGAACHFHVVNWDDDCEKVLAGLPNHVTVSAEEYPHKRDFTYFASVRFLRASELMQELGPLYITDIDNRFDAPLSSIEEQLGGFDAGFRNHSGGTWFLWWAPSGGNLWLNDTAGGRQIASWLASYIKARFIPNLAKTWWFDQLALNEVNWLASQQGLRVANLSEPSFNISVARPYAEIAALKSKY